MKPYLALLFALVLFSACDCKSEGEKPTQAEIVGVWECHDFPVGFLSEVDATLSTATSRIVFRKDGSCAANSFPQRTPYRFIEITKAYWTVADPSKTPSGAWSVEFGGHFLQCRKTADGLILQYTISGADEYRVQFKWTK